MPSYIQLALNNFDNHGMDPEAAEKLTEVNRSLGNFAVRRRFYTTMV